MGHGRDRRDIPTLSKRIIEAYLDSRSKSGKLPYPLGDKVMGAVYYLGKNPACKTNLVTEFSLTADEDKLVANIVDGARKFYSRRSRWG